MIGAICIHRGKKVASWKRMIIELDSHPSMPTRSRYGTRGFRQGAYIWGTVRTSVFGVKYLLAAVKVHGDVTRRENQQGK